MIMNGKKIAEIMENKTVQPLDNEMEIEDIISVVKDIDNKISFYERLKKNRVASITEEITKLDERKKLFKDIIQATLDKFNFKSLKFPGIGRVTSKGAKNKWIIKDEDQLIDFLKTELNSDRFEIVVKNKPTIVKSELNDILDGLKKENKIPNCIQEDIGEKSVSISFEETEEGIKNESVDVDQIIQDFDTLNSQPIKPSDIDF